MNPLMRSGNHLLKTFEKWGDLAKSQYLESTIFMSGYLLSSQGDRMAMANSVEGRYPFLDHRVIEYAATLPESYKLNCLNEKFILKKMMKGKIPESILKRHKQAYRAPIHTSFIGPEAPEYVKELLNETTIKSFGYFDPGKVDKLVEKIGQNGQVTEMENMALAGIISTQLLHHFFIQDNVFVSPAEKPANLIIIRDQVLIIVYSRPYPCLQSFNSNAAYNHDETDKETGMGDKGKILTIKPCLVSISTFPLVRSLNDPLNSIRKLPRSNRQGDRENGRQGERILQSSLSLSPLIPFSPCLPVHFSPFLFVSFLLVSLSPCLHFSISPCQIVKRRF